MSAPTALLEDIVISVPGVYDIPADAYFADPVPGGSLSHSGGRLLLPPSCPALFKHDRDNPRPTRKVFETGHAAHRLVLGVGPELVLVDRPRWDTTEVKAEVASLRAAGKIPLKSAEYEQVQAMAAALRNFLGPDIFAADSGRAEQSLFWQDPVTGVWRRARLDWLPNPRVGRTVLLDYKSCRSAALSDLQKAMNEYGYHTQAATYLDGAIHLGVASPDARFVFIAQEKTPPYLVTPFEPDAFALRVAQDLNREALQLFRECTETGHWPGYTDKVEQLSLPPWVEREYVGVTP